MGIPQLGTRQMQIPRNLRQKGTAANAQRFQQVNVLANINTRCNILMPILEYTRARTPLRIVTHVKDTHSIYCANDTPETQKTFAFSSSGLRRCELRTRGTDNGAYCDDTPRQYCLAGIIPRPAPMLCSLERDIGVYWYLFSNLCTRKCIHKEDHAQEMKVRAPMKAQT